MKQEAKNDNVQCAVLSYGGHEIIRRKRGVVSIVNPNTLS
jgi:hypothetical protein